MTKVPALAENRKDGAPSPQPQNQLNAGTRARRQKSQNQSCDRGMMWRVHSWYGPSPLQISCPQCAFGRLDHPMLFINGIQDVKSSVIQRPRPIGEIKVARPYKNLKTKIIANSHISEPLPRSVYQLRYRNDHLILAGFGSGTTCREALRTIRIKPCLQQQNRKSFSFNLIITNNQDPSCISDVRLQARTNLFISLRRETHHVSPIFNLKIG